MEKIKLFLIDDHPMFLEGLVSILNDNEGIEIAGIAHSANEYLEKEGEVDTDVFIIDVNMPEMSGIEITKHIKEKNPMAKVLALSMYEDSIYIQKMIENGANGYIKKSSRIKELLEAIRVIVSGRTYLGEDLKKVIFAKFGRINMFEDQEPVKPSNLSTREIEILGLIARDFSTKQISDKLFISELTVKTHRKNILAKTKVNSMVGLVKYAIRKGLVDY